MKISNVFRAWNKEEKKMYYLEYRKSFLMICEDGSWSLDKPSKKYRHELLTEHIKVSSKNGILMQSTGLFDKNKKEIFEGDIVTGKRRQTFQYLTKGIHKGIVNFHNGSFRIEIKKVGNPHIGMLYDFEVIGNIHKNPELLKVK